MINAARTLLLNRDGVGFIDRLGEEYTPPEFRRVSLPGPIMSLRNYLFGRDPDWLMYNYRMRQYMTILHAAELEEFVLALDDRITYRFDNANLFALAPTVTRLQGSDDLTLVGDVGEPDAAGRCYHSWRVEVVSGAAVRVVRQTKPASDDLVLYDVEGTQSKLITLTGSKLLARFPPTIGNAWQIVATARPTLELGDLVATISKLGDTIPATIFGLADKRRNTEPWTTFNNLWYDHPELPYRLGGLLLGVIYTTNMIRETGSRG